MILQLVPAVHTLTFYFEGNGDNMDVSHCREQRLKPPFMLPLSPGTFARRLLDLPPPPFLSNSSSLKWNMWTLRVSDRVSHTLTSNVQQYHLSRCYRSSDVRAQRKSSNLPERLPFFFFILTNNQLSSSCDISFTSANHCQQLLSSRGKAAVRRSGSV